MILIDTYKTIESLSQGIYKEKGSKFIAFAIPVSSVNEINSIIKTYRREYHDARHHCYAYMIGLERKDWRVNDDGEPSGTAGKPILGQINSFRLTNILIVVIRYFGGKLLGASGLINAYRTAASEAIKNSRIIERTMRVYYEIKFPYSSINEVMKVLKDDEINQSDQKFEMQCTIKISFRKMAKERILNKLSLIENLTLYLIEEH